MSTSTVPMFDPQGTLRDVPYLQMMDALHAGGKPATLFQAPDGTHRYVPSDQTTAAVKAGGKVLPIEQQPAKSFWSEAGSTLWNNIKSIPSALTAPDPLADPNVSDADKSKLVAQSEADAAAKNAKRTKERGVAYSLGANVNEMLGVNVAGEEQAAREGNPGAVVGHAATVPVTMAATAAAARVLPAIPDAVRAAAETETGGKLAASAKVIGASAEELPVVGKVVKAARKLRDLRDIWGAKPVYPGAPLPEHPGVFPGAPEPTATLEQLNPSLVSPARSLPGQISPEVIRPPAPPIPARPGLLLSGEVAPESAGSSVAQPKTLADLSGAPSGAGVPRTLSGESALRQVLTGQDTPNLMKIAKSRGINVTQESQLKPSLAGPRLINKIVDDFSTDELSDMRDNYLENTRMGRHDFGDIGAEANKTLSLKTYFPDVKIPASVEIRTARAIADAGTKASAPKFSTVGDVAGQIKEAAQKPRTLQDLSPSPTATPPTAASADLTSLLQQSVDQAKTQGVQTTASPARLMKRWGVDEESLASGREQTRGMSPEDTEADLAALTERYKKGEAVEPIVETRDADNNVISVDGRARAIAAQRAGVKRIPIIVRRAAAEVSQ